MNVQFENEVISFLNLPSLPKRIWDGKSNFEKGVAIVDLLSGEKAYAVAKYDSTVHESPIITKVFSQEPFTSKDMKIFIVPDYMETDMSSSDLDDESKKKAEEIVKEASDIENEGIEDVTETTENKNPYLFDFIHNDEEAIAFIKSYNEKNKIYGKLPKKHETILMRLSVIFAEANKK